MKMPCEEVQAALAPFHVCEETADGACVTTHCLYPSFDPVKVYVSRHSGGFRVHDGGGAERSAWLHGRDDHVISKVLSRQAGRYQVKVSENLLLVDVPSAEWLRSGILAVANASASAANVIVEKSVTPSGGSMEWTRLRPPPRRVFALSGNCGWMPRTGDEAGNQSI